MVTQMAVSFNVSDPRASAEFLIRHLGFSVDMEQGGDFISLKPPVDGANVIFLRTGLATFKPTHRAGAAGEGTLLVFVVDDLDELHARIVRGGATVVTPPETEPWGERFCQYEDPNGLIMQLVQWV